MMVVVALCAALALTVTGCSGDWPGPLGALDADRSGTGTVTDAAPASGSPGPSISSTPAASGSASASSPSPSASIPVLVPPQLRAAEGYSYVKAPAAVVKAFAPVAAAGYRGVLSAPTVRGVQKSKTGIGSVAAMTVEASHLADTETVQSLLTGLVSGMSGKGYTLRTRTVSVDGANEDVMVAFRKGSTIAAWLFEGQVMAFVSSQPESTALAYAKSCMSS